MTVCKEDEGEVARKQEGVGKGIDGIGRCKVSKSVVISCEGSTIGADEVGQYL